MFRTLQKTTLLLLFAAVPLTAKAEPAGQRFTLGSYVPADAWLYLHGATNPERAWIDQKWREVFEEVKKSGVDRDLMNLITSQVPPEERAAFTAGVDKVLGLVRAVDWGGLAGEEMAFAERRSPNMPLFDYVLLVRSKPGTSEANMKALTTILDEIAALDESIRVHPEQRYGVDVRRMVFGGAPDALSDFSVVLLRKGDVFGLVTGRHTIEDVLALVGGKAPGKSIVESPRFKAAVGDLPAAENELVFFDCEGFLKGLENIMTVAFVHVDGPSNQDAQRVLKAAITELGILDYVVTTSETKGVQDLSHSTCRFMAGKESRPIAQAVMNRKPFTKFDEFIPADATGFSLSGGVDLGLVYDAVLDFVATKTPDGPQNLAAYHASLAELGFDPWQDVFDWLSGEMISVSLPAAMATPMGGGDGVLMIRVKNVELATQKVDIALGKLAGFVQQNMGQPLSIMPMSGSTSGFKQIAFGPLMMFMQPVIGVHGEWLMVGTSPQAITRCLNVAAGKAPSIRENPRFAREGLIPTKPVYSLTFADKSKTGQEIAGFLGMAGMFAGMATAGMANDPQLAEGRQMIQTLAGVAMKLAPAAAKIDFFSSHASVSTMEGNVIRTEAVMTYKKDPPKPAPQPATSAGVSGS